MDAVDPIIFRLAIFVLAIFVGYYVVWSVTPALHTPLMSVTNAISSVIIVGAIIAAAAGAARLGARDVDVACNRIISSFQAAETELVPPAFWAPEEANMQAHVGCRQAYSEKAAQLQAERDAGGSSASTLIARSAGVLAALLASVNIFGGFLVTQRMLAMYKKKEKPAIAKG